MPRRRTATPAKSAVSKRKPAAKPRAGRAKSYPAAVMDDLDDQPSPAAVKDDDGDELDDIDLNIDDDAARDEDNEDADDDDDGKGLLSELDDDEDDEEDDDDLDEDEDDGAARRWQPPAVEAPKQTAGQQRMEQYKRGKPKGPMPRPTGSKLKGEGFFAYLGGLPEAFHDRLVMYVYRTYPVIDRALSGCKYNYIDKMTPEEFNPGADTFMHECMRRWGTGDYHIKLNDTQTGRTLCTTNINTPREYIDYPPLLNVDEVSWQDPANAPYREKMRATGKYAEVKEEQVKAEEQAKTEGMIGLVDRLIQRLDSGKETSAEVKTLMHTFGMSQEILKESVMEAQKLSGRQGDPMEIVKQIIAMTNTVGAKEAKDAGSDATLIKLLLESQQSGSAVVLQLMQAQMASKEAEVAAMREEMRELRRDMRRTNPEGEEGRSKGLIDHMREMAEVRELMSEFAGGGDGAPRKAGFDWSSLVPLASKLVDSLGSMTHNVAVARTGTGTPIAPSAAGQGQGQGAIQQGAEPGAEQQTADMGADMNMMTMLARQVADPLRHHLADPDRNGADFADWFIMTFGRTAYLQVVEAERAEPGSITGLLQLNPELWRELVGIPGTLNEFIQEFITAEDRTEDEPTDEGGEAESAEVEPPIAPPVA